MFCKWLFTVVVIVVWQKAPALTEVVFWGGGEAVCLIWTPFVDFFFCRQNILHKRFFNWSGKLSWGQEEAGILARAPHSLNLGSKLGVGIQFYCGILSKIIVLIGLNYVFILSGQRDLEHLRLHEMRSNEGKEDMWV